MFNKEQYLTTIHITAYNIAKQMLNEKRCNFYVLITTDQPPKTLYPGKRWKDTHQQNCIVFIC